MLDKKHKLIKLAWDVLAPLSGTRSQPPIFIAGMPRSGTTWMVYILATAAGIKYFHEPFNPYLFSKAEKYSGKYLRINDEDKEFTAYCRKVLNSYWPDRMMIKDVHYLIDKKVPWWPGRLMIKDVHSLMALEWIDRQITPVIVIALRHPCGLASSWFKASWKPGGEIKKLLNQSKLIEDYLQPFESLLREAQGDFCKGMGALWGAYYYVALEQKRKNYPNWIVVKHEDLCQEPVDQYRQLFKQLNLHWNTVTDYILDASTNGDSGKRYLPGRKSSQEPDKWKKILEPQQIKLIRDFAEPFGIPYYQEY